MFDVLQKFKRINCAVIEGAVCTALEYSLEDVDMPVTTIRIQAELEVPLEALCRKYNRSKSSLINQALKEFMAQDALAELRWQKTLPALRSMKSGKGAPAEEVFKWMQGWIVDEELPRPKC